MTEPDFNQDLHASLDVIGRHFRRAQTDAANDGGELSELDCAMGNVVQLVPLLLEDYTTAWAVAALAQQLVDEVDAETRKKVAKVLRSPGGLVVPR